MKAVAPDLGPGPTGPAARGHQTIQGGRDLWPAKLKSVPSGSTCPTKRSPTFGGASPRRAGPARSSSTTGRRACSWRRAGSSPATGTTEYDWRACEARLNALPQFTTEIDGVDIHFIHVRSRHENALPLIMTHGWPGSVIELLETVGPLTDPTAHGGSAGDAFHLVLPSIPGYGFSGRADRARLVRRPRRAGVGGADAPPRLHPLRRPGRRRGRRASPTRWAARHPRGWPAST